MANKMLIDATHPEETRVVVVRGNRVEEFDFETAHRKQLRGNIYLAKVTRVEPSLQAAFVDYGGNRHGFLAFSEIHPDYYQIPIADRQALIDEEQRAQRADEEDFGEERGRGRRDRRYREARRRERVDELRREESLVAEEAAPEAAETPAGEAVQGEPPVAELASDQAADIQPSAEAPGGASAAEQAQPAIDVELVDPAARELQFDAGRDDLPARPGEPGAEEAVPAAIPPESSPMLSAEATASETGEGPTAEEVTEEEVVESVGGSDALEEVPDRAPRVRRQYKIQEVIKRRQVLLVQVVKEERGSKGAALTTYLSLAGRYCVLMPNTARGGGISRKITNPEDRRRLREIAERLQVPEGMGVILRTAGANRSTSEIERDFEYLLRQWEMVRDLTLRSTAPTLVYEEGSLIKRSIRDLYGKDIDEIIVAGEAGYNEAKEFLNMLMPGHGGNVKLYRDSQPLFTRYGIESQLDAMFSPVVQLKSGGYVVINQTEALVSIDVNSGRATREHHIEDTALKTNLEAAEEIARQLRLRDLAGLIVIDFIDMDENRNNRMVERRLKDALRNDRARIQVGRISHFGLLEMSRQRIRTSVLESSTEKCPYCGGTGHTRSVSSVALQLLRSIEETLLKGATHNLVVRTRPEIALYVLNQKRAHLRELEERFRVTITVNADESVTGQVAFTIERGEQVMSIEQARAVAAEAAAQFASAPEPAPVEEAEEPEVAEEEADRTEWQRQPVQPALAMHDIAEREGGRRRRRRRRRGRGNGGRERGPFTHETMAEHVVAHEEDFEEISTTAEAAPTPAEQQHAERDEGERRRRRRGRRGGRRNRRGREAYEDSQHAGQPQAYPESPEAPEADRATMEPAQTYAEPQPARQSFETVTPEAVGAAPEPVAPPPEPAPTSAAEPELPRRRSTVREPVFASQGGEPAPRPTVPVTITETDVPASSGAETEITDRPRRTGWWAKRLMGDKG